MENTDYYTGVNPCNKCKNLPIKILYRGYICLNCETDPSHAIFKMDDKEAIDNWNKENERTI